MKTVSCSLAAVWLICALAPAAAQAPYPNKPIRMVVAFPPGGGTDINARLIGASLQASLGQPVVIENRPGANGLVGTTQVAKSPADGYTLSMGAGGPLTINHQVMKNVPLDPLRDLAPVATVSAHVLSLVVHPSFPAHSVKELIDIVKARRDGYSYASAAIASPHHLTMELFQSLSGTHMVHVPYKGSGDAIKDLVAGQVRIAFETVSVILPHVNAGRLRMLAVTSRQRSSLAPQVPSMTESGFPGFESFSWYGVVAPAGTPRPIINTLNAEIRKALTTAEVRGRLSQLGAEPLSGTPDDMEKFMRDEIAKWGRVIRDVNITVD
ncbi:MAG: tripartite tricarboxylate transporter substrate binding protein [Burkholderiales bacterium]|nr:tripartite tricarboxylate transporter substrate binding protein [Burkholderiales bacterium]